MGDVNNRHLGVLTVDGEPKPALDALRFARRLFSEEAFRPTEHVRITRGSLSDAQVRCFERPDGSVFCIAWLPAHIPGERTAETGLVRDARVERLEVAVDGDARQATLFSARGTRVGAVPGDAGGRFAIDVRGGQVLVITLEPSAAAAR